MRLNLRLFGTALLFAALIFAVGCSGKKNEDKDHKDHKDDEHKEKKEKDNKKDDDHPSKGPNGGPLAEWGNEEYHSEFTVDHKTKKATVYVLDGSAKKAAPIEAESVSVTITSLKPPLQITLKADPQKGDPQGKASRFSGTHEKLGEEIDLKGEISGKVGGKPYSGKFEEKDHDHKKEK